MNTLNKLAVRVCLPLFAIACVTQPPSQDMHDAIKKIAQWFFSAPAAVQIFQLIVWGVGVFAALYFVFEVINDLILRFTGYWVCDAIGMILSLFAVAAFCKLETVDPMPTVNVFWELALGSLGFLLIDVSEPKA